MGFGYARGHAEEISVVETVVAGEIPSYAAPSCVETFWEAKVGSGLAKCADMIGGGIVTLAVAACVGVVLETVAKTEGEIVHIVVQWIEIGVSIKIEHGVTSHKGAHLVELKIEKLIPTKSKSGKTISKRRKIGSKKKS